MPEVTYFKTFFFLQTIERGREKIFIVNAFVKSSMKSSIYHFSCLFNFLVFFSFFFFCIGNQHFHLSGSNSTFALISGRSMVSYSTSFFFLFSFACEFLGAGPLVFLRNWGQFKELDNGMIQFVCSFGWRFSQVWSTVFLYCFN